MTPVTTAAEFAAALAETRAWLHLSVEWSGPERASRRVVGELVEAWQRHPDTLPT